ncbi:MAG TPA: hypothetical protein PKK10_14005 [Woeseiaceae bacterium]|nr:hypothetical protein [Woeseiaceae bacterium]
MATPAQNLPMEETKKAASDVSSKTVKEGIDALVDSKIAFKVSVRGSIEVSPSEYRAYLAKKKSK